MIIILKRHISNITIILFLYTIGSTSAVTAMEKPYRTIELSNLLDYPISLLQYNIKSQQSLIIIGQRIPANTIQPLEPLHTTHLTFLLPNYVRARCTIPINKRQTTIIIKKGLNNAIIIVDQQKHLLGWTYPQTTL